MNNYLDSCRTCLADSNDMRKLNTSVSISGKQVFLTDILQKFYNFEVSAADNLPQNICINCIYQLTITYSFKILIESSSKTLEDILQHGDNDDEPDQDFSQESDDDKKPLVQYLNDTKRTKKATKTRYAVPVIKTEKIKETSSEVKLFCVECKNVFKSTYDLLEHCTDHHPIKSHIGRGCEYCNEKLEDFRSLALHRKLHLQPYVCQNCWAGFEESEMLATHTCVRSIAKPDKDKTDRVLRQCEKCGKSYPPGYIQIHMKTHGEDRPYCCKLCPKKFKVPGALNSHVQWNHKRTRNHKCEYCNTMFITASSRSAHVRKNHLKEKKYPCKCGKRFFSKSELERHNLTHTGAKNFHCHLCDKSYQTRYGLNVHLKSHTQMPRGEYI